MPAKINLIGYSFGRWKVLSEGIPRNKAEGCFWFCQCECGTQRDVSGASLRSGKSQSCGCLKEESVSVKKGPKNLAGQKFNRLTAIDVAYQDREYYWNCICDCGNKVVVRGSQLPRGKTKSCGCLNREQLSARGKHWLTKSPEYKVWIHMRERCLDPDDAGYPNYGGRGIKVCERWMQFENFIADMGQRPSNEHSLERIDNNGDYCPENCRWATRAEQCRNRRSNVFLTYQGKTQCITDWAADLGMSHTSLSSRIKRGWDIEKALSTQKLNRMKQGA